MSNPPVPERTLSEEVEQIQSAMQRIRCDLDDDFKQVRASASRLTDWQHYVKRYPWVTIGAASLIGCLVVPRRKEYAAHLDSDSLQRIISSISSRPQRSSSPRDEHEEEVDNAENSGYLKGMGTVVFGMVMRAAANHVVNKYLGQSNSSIWNTGKGSSGGHSPGASTTADASYVDDHAV
ncbi:hypothetical protein Pla110_17440 [Polystyrenella longa]|uniref:DUF3618 domain-containing protein n=1 Tax=Polystyrenella longa TaxID=2528007 RepID=A0A518CLB5_9PLAN|nr:hypothetical protein [Polystyrenella longa]QDU80022.1 hypothetical protein Pla110_17440 [Polystyrenella longa]